MSKFDYDVLTFFNATEQLLTEKNHDYADPNTTGDPFHAFRTIADGLGITVRQVWAVFFLKHVHAVITHCSSDRPLVSEDIGSRLKDIAAYAAILNAWENQ